MKIAILPAFLGNREINVLKFRRFILMTGKRAFAFIRSPSLLSPPLFPPDPKERPKEKERKRLRAAAARDLNANED